MSHEPCYEVDIRYDLRIPVRDGLALSANLFLPVPRAEGQRFPAILEMIPYRKDDWRYQADHQRMTYLAQRGFAGCRLDIRGTGSSPGIALDEYTADETRDGYDAVEWLAAQPWCNGNVGMWGISYGGFTAIQVAMLQPPSLKAIVPMYATDDRYTDDVHYLGGCFTASELAQYAVSQVAMNAMPPKPQYAGSDWAAQWKQRLEQTPPWLLAWFREQTDGPYWRSGSLAPDYERITCAIFHIGGWADGYTSPVLRMQERCVHAPRKALIGPWVHSLPDSAYPGPNIDWLHELVRFFAFWLKGEQNGVMDEPPLTIFREEYTAPEAFPARKNGAWHSEAAYPIPRSYPLTFSLGDGTLEEESVVSGQLSVAADHRPPTTDHRPLTADHRTEEGERGSGGAGERGTTNNGQRTTDKLTYRPTLGTHAALCYGAGVAPNGLARDLRPDEALGLTYTSPPLAAPHDIVGFPEATLYLSCTAPVATIVVRLTDVAPDGTSAPISIGILNLTHRAGHADPQPLTPGEVVMVRVPLKATGYRFLAGQRIRLSVAGGYWPVVWPSPYPCEHTLHRAAATPSRLVLPLVPVAETPAPPSFKTTPPELIEIGEGSEDPPVWQIVEDVIAQSVTVRVAGGDTATIPGGTRLSTAERLEMCAYRHDPAHARMFNEVLYTLEEHGYRTEIRTSGSVRSTADTFHVDIQLAVLLNGHEFFRKAWIESIPRKLV